MNGWLNEGIIEQTNVLHRPSVSSISSEQQLQQLQLELSNDVFFLLITGPAPDDDDVHNLSVCSCW